MLTLFTLKYVVVHFSHILYLTLLQQIDFGEETGPRTVVSGLVNYIPIEEMRDKILVGVVSIQVRSLICRAADWSW